jgi:hypothetical protein
MRKLALLVLLMAPGLAFSQVSMSAGIRIDLPVVLPQLVIVTPGVRVVPEIDHEVFFANGYYWAREPNGWYRSRSHRGGWVIAPLRVVPASIVKIPPGHYKRWTPAKGHWHQKHNRGGGPARASRFDDRRDRDRRDFDGRDDDRRDHGDRRDDDRRDHDDRDGGKHDKGNGKHKH